MRPHGLATIPKLSALVVRTVYAAGHMIIASNLMGLQKGKGRAPES